MGMIKVIFDPQPPGTQISNEISMPLTNPGYEEHIEGQAPNMADIDQSLVYGVRCPIISIEGFVISWQDIIEFEFHDDDHMPYMNCRVYDEKKIIRQLLPPVNAPGNNNTRIDVQILPPHDQYKKIDCHFIMTNYYIGKNNEVSISAVYDLPDFTNINFKSFGELKLYELYVKMAQELKLGFATNAEEKEDKRFMFCKYTSYKNLLDQETNNSGEEKLIYNWWIDPWHYLILEDIYDRYTVADNLNLEPDQFIWISGQVKDQTCGADYEPLRVKAELTNLIGSEDTQVYVKKYRVINNVGSDLSAGTDKVYSTYSMKNKKYEDKLFIDSSEKLPLKNLQYTGEVYGDYDYITNNLYHIPFYQKMNKEIVEVDLPTPLLGLTRGHQLILSVYINDDAWDNTRVIMEKNDIIIPYTDIEPAGNPVDLIHGDIESQEQHDHFKLDKKISSQYLVIGNVYKYKKNQWTHTVKLVRPDDRRINMWKN